MIGQLYTRSSACLPNRNTFQQLSDCSEMYTEPLFLLHINPSFHSPSALTPSPAPSPRLPPAPEHDGKCGAMLFWAYPHQVLITSLPPSLHCSLRWDMNASLQRCNPERLAFAHSHTHQWSLPDQAHLLTCVPRNVENAHMHAQSQCFQSPTVQQS